MIKSLLVKIYKKIKKYLFIIKFYSKKKYDYLLLLTPEHENIGDSLIVLAEQRLLKKLRLSYFEVTISEWIRFKYFLLNNKNRYKGILITGGGNLGNLYGWYEKIRREIITSFLDKKIISFPQTLYFTNDSKGREEKVISEKTYNRHKNLHLFFRDKHSYSAGKKIFNECNVYLTPDITLTLNKRKKKTHKSHRVLLILRNDLEKIDNEKEINYLIKVLKNKKFKIVETDNLYKTNIKKGMRLYPCLHKLNQISKYDIVITDRLHGVLMSYICVVPCIAFDNSYNKIQNGISWLKDNPFIRFYNNFTDKKNIENFDKNAAEQFIDKKLFSVLEKTLKTI